MITVVVGIELGSSELGSEDDVNGYDDSYFLALTFFGSNFRS